MGKLNISHHKSWHPYSHKAQEIVRKDEEAAALIQKAKDDKTLAQEREFRLNSLKSRAGVPSDSSSSSKQSISKPGNIDLFSSLIKEEEKEASSKKYGKNAEFMKEEAAKEKKWEKQITTYLVPDDQTKPWYTQKGTGDYYTGEKTKLDPMAIMSKIGKFSTSKKTPVDRASSRKGNGTSIEAMRAERLEREQAERKREALLLNPELANQIAERDARHANEGGYYNSGYTRRR